MMMETHVLAGWGNYPRAACRLVHAGGAALPALVAAEPSLIARGNGRAYGDAALNQRATLMMDRHDRILAFDPATGRVRAEAGVMLADILDLFLPRGFFPPVTPGTKLVTLGGMVAADVHGKNHHVDGSFCRHVEALELILPDGAMVACTPTQNADLFQATCGGMGLTGVIATVTFRLRRVETAWIRQETVRCPDLASAMRALEQAQDSTYAVGWIDGLAGGPHLGRSLVYRGEHAGLDDLDAIRRADPLRIPHRRPLTLPIDLPGLALNGLSVRAFNALYYRRGRPGTALVDWDRYFYPLDSILAWNRLYGRGGFTQYQCVLPRDSSEPGLRALLTRIARAGIGSFLAVLKLLGGQGDGLLSFPVEGYTLALDFPMKPATLPLLRELDAIVADHGGRLYLAKDARMDADMLRRCYGKRLEQFRAIRHRIGADSHFHSLLSERLGL